MFDYLACADEETGVECVCLVASVGASFISGLGLELEEGLGLGLAMGFGEGREDSREECLFLFLAAVYDEARRNE